MSDRNKTILLEANAAIAEGKNERFLSFCADDMEWTFVGEKTLKGKEAVRQWMATAYVEPPKFMVTNLIAEGDFITALGDITMKDEDGKAAHYSYCDVWRFRSGKIAELKAFVIKTDFKREQPDLDFRRNRIILQDKVALVTDGTSGIGRATAIAYAQQQAKVVVGRRIDEGEETVKNAKTEHRFPATHNRSIPYDPA
ncbi:SDR family NAD(P)-dependent oxidoreductase [Altericista sp. CCNU0014]|uniref:SDR family NAD(P)-dependent oxidoreductase n=1 Tax=Altericista sp. CCNU0014 TaxID=3082949 RepID=UPI00384BAB1E